MTKYATLKSSEIERLRALAAIIRLNATAEGERWATYDAAMKDGSSKATRRIARNDYLRAAHELDRAVQRLWTALANPLEVHEEAGE